MRFDRLVCKSCQVVVVQRSDFCRVATLDHASDRFVAVQHRACPVGFRGPHRQVDCRKCHAARQIVRVNLQVRPRRVDVRLIQTRTGTPRMQKLQHPEHGLMSAADRGSATHRRERLQYVGPTTALGATGLTGRLVLSQLQIFRLHDSAQHASSPRELGMDDKGDNGGQNHHEHGLHPGSLLTG